MEFELDRNAEQLRRGAKLQIPASVLMAVAGTGVLLWFFSHTRRLFDYYQAYIIGVGVFLLLAGLATLLRAALLLGSPARLSVAAANQAAQRAARLNESAMAMGFKLYMTVMLVGLIYIGEVYNRTAFIVCFFTQVFAYFCFFFSWLWLKQTRK